MVIEAPKEVKTNFVVTVYDDMEYADDISECTTFDTYEEALKEYNTHIEMLGHVKFVTLELETEVISATGKTTYPDNIRLADNYKQVLFYTIVADFGDKIGTATFFETDSLEELDEEFNKIIEGGDVLYKEAYNSLPLIKAERVLACVVLEGGLEEVKKSFNIPKETVDI